MLHFINTEIVKENHPIHIAVYYDNFIKATVLIERLIMNESVIEQRKTKDYYEVFLDKKGYKIKIKTLPLSDSSRGHRHHYSFIDSALLARENRLDLYYYLIRSATVNHNMKEEYQQMNHFEPRFMLY